MYATAIVRKGGVCLLCACVCVCVCDNYQSYCKLESFFILVHSAIVSQSFAPGLDECLLHVAVDSESGPIFEMLLEYSEQSSRAWPDHQHVTYPWPNDEPLNATSWTVCIPFPAA